MTTRFLTALTAVACSFLAPASGLAQPSGSIVGWGSQVVLPQSELANLTAIAARGGHSLGLKPDGSIVAWGGDSVGQCNVPAPNADFTAIAAGGHHTLAIRAATPVWYLNCDGSTQAPILNVDDFTCFINDFATASALPHGQQVTHYANCDGSTTAPVLNVDDFTCFINAFAAGCP
jgi:hypothetical protein